jgi:hypothetical protein
MICITGKYLKPKLFVSGFSVPHLYPAIRNFEAVGDDGTPTDSVPAGLLVWPTVCSPTYLNKLYPYDMHHENSPTYLKTLYNV